MTAPSNSTTTPDDLLATLTALLAPGKNTRFADWDEAVTRRKPLRFKFLNMHWQIKTVDFQDLAAMFQPATYAGLSEAQATQKQLDFIGEHVSEPEAWKKKTSAAKIAPSTAMGGLTWILRKEAGMPLEIVDGEDPLDRPLAFSSSASGNGRSSAGGSRKSASKTP
jgi:hypothetical protein